MFEMFYRMMERSLKTIQHFCPSSPSISVVYSSFVNTALTSLTFFFLMTGSTPPPTAPPTQPPTQPPSTQPPSTNQPSPLPPTGTQAPSLGVGEW